MIFNIPLDGGIHRSTVFKNNVLSLAPKLQCTSFLGDTDWWQSSGRSWTIVNDDQVQLNVPETATDEENVILLTYHLEQTTKEPITARVVVQGDNVVLHEGATFGINVFDDNGLFNVTTNFATGTFEATQFEVKVNPSAPINWVYIKLKVYNTTGKVTMWDGELFQDNDEDGFYGEFTSPIIDFFETSHSPITLGGLEPEIATFYYGKPSSVDDLRSVTHSVDMLKPFDIVVLQSANLNDSRDTIVVQQLIDAGVKVFGYTALSSAPSFDSIKADVDSCKQHGYYGVFVDEFGYYDEPSGYATIIDRDTQNSVVDYIKSQGLKVIANGFPWEVLDSSVDSQFNPQGHAIHLDENDYTLIESFYSGSDNLYDGNDAGFKDDPFDNYSKAAALSNTTNIKVMTLAYSFEDKTLDEQLEDFKTGYILFLGFGFDCFAQGFINSGSDNNFIAWTRDTFPSDNFGSELLERWHYISDKTLQAKTDGGLLEFSYTDKPNPTRSSDAYNTESDMPKIIIPNPPMIQDDILSNFFYETSKDKVTWLRYDRPPIHPERYFRYRAQLRK